MTEWQAELDEALDALTDNPYSDVAVQRIRDLFDRARTEAYAEGVKDEAKEWFGKAVKRAEVREMLTAGIFAALCEAIGNWRANRANAGRHADAILREHGWGE